MKATKINSNMVCFQIVLCHWPLFVHFVQGINIDAELSDDDEDDDDYSWILIQHIYSMYKS